MSKKIRNAPKIRFPGFTDDWEQRKFGEITELKSASRVHREEWTSEGVPFYRSSDVMSAIKGTQNEKAFISEELYEKLSSVSGKLEEGDVLITGGGSVGNPFIVPNNEPLYTKDADLLWIKNQGRFDAYFIYEFFFSPAFRTYLSSVSHIGTIAHYTITQLADTPISLPSLEEQKELGGFFKELDNLITLHQRQLEDIKEYKQGLLQKMFPQKGATIPELRFPGFTDDWEQRKLNEFAEYTSSALTAKDSSIDGLYDLYDANELIGKTDSKCMDQEYITIIKDGAGVGRIRKLPSKTMFIGTMGAITPKNCELEFLYALLTKANLGKTYTGSTIPHIYFKDYGNEQYYIPSRVEQERIGSFFANLDNTIALHQRQLEDMKEYKKGLLQQMFV